jgi:membrane-associated phospholipid phosphatase
MRLPLTIRVASWTFLALTCVATIYLGWHFFVDVLAGLGVGTAAFVLAAKATGNPLRRRAEPWTFRAALEVSGPARDDELRATRR